MLVTVSGSIGVRITIDAEPMDAFDCEHIERSIVQFLHILGICLWFSFHRRRNRSLILSSPIVFHILLLHRILLLVGRLLVSLL